MTRSEHIRALLEEYARQRGENEADLRRRTERVHALEPEIARLQEESATLALRSMREILSRQTTEERIAVAEEMKRRGRAINAEIRTLLKRLGLPEDELQLRYRCDRCKDTGYVGEAPSRFCDCFEMRLRKRQYEDGTMAGTDEQNFGKFNEALFPEEGDQLKLMVATRNMCEQYANQFPDTRFRNILLTGEGGLGKTFLLNCIYERVTSRGFSAVRITAFRMFEAMRRQHIGNDEDFEGFSELIETPLLLIDDLGTEPMMRNITVEYLFTLLNERIAADRHTVVATNLTIPQIKERYGERVVSRLTDKNNCFRIQLKGKDLRNL